MPADNKNTESNKIVNSSTSLTMEKFCAESDEWCLYVERLENFFSATTITDDAKKRDTLLNSIGALTYKILRDLCSPDLPSKKSYAELCSFLQLYYTPTVITHKERKTFYNATRECSESVVEWLAKIKRLAHNCEFGSRFSDVILDKFITGLGAKAFDRVCEEDYKALSLDKAVELAIKYEKQVKEIDYVQRGSKNSGRNGNSRLKSKGDKRKVRETKSEVKCLHCGYRNHASSECKYKDATCHNCKRVGHIATVCRKTDRTVNLMTKEEDNVLQMSDYLADNLYHVESSVSTNEAIKINVTIDSVQMKFIVDSGSAVSVVNDRIYQAKFNKCQLKPSNINLYAYSGHNIEILGSFQPIVTCNEISKPLAILVVRGNGPAILGRDFMQIFNFTFAQLNEISTEETLESLLNRFAELFDGKLGKFKYNTINLNIEPNVKPIFCKPRPVPYAFRDTIEAELIRLEKLGVIEPIPTSEWGTPLVPVLKEDGSIRLCVDYSVTLNKYLVNNNHPIPRLDEIINALEGGQEFTKLDMEMAYNQMVFNFESSLLAAWSTTMGIFRALRLSFGLKTAMADFQCEMDKLTQRLPGVFVFVDDIIVTGRTRQEHLENLRRLLQVLLDAGLKLKRSKCAFFQKSVEFLGHVISKDGITKTEKRVEAVLHASEPTNTTEVRAFAGMVNYYGRFLKHIAQTMSPIYNLLRKDVKFTWNAECQAAFEQVKGDIATKVTLAHYNPKLPIILETDACEKGISGVLIHVFPTEERPVVFFSRTLTPAEENYPVIQKEALAIVESTKKFYQYLIGRRFKLRTDHKPLTAIFGESKGIPVIAAARMQRWAYHLSAYDFSIEHVPGSRNIVADALSRLPRRVPAAQVSEKTFIDFLFDTGIKLNQSLVRKETAVDNILSKVFQRIMASNAESLKGDEFKPYVQRFSELSIESGIIVWGFRVVIPQKLREAVLKSLHVSHLGIVKCKSMARSIVWWPGIDNDIERFIKGCEACQALRPSPPKAELISWQNTGKPWSRIHIDYAGPYRNLYFFIITDSFSKWVEVIKTKTITTEFTVRALSEVFARFGLPETIVSDAGTQFTAALFQNFAKVNGIKSIVVAPAHPASNGAAENSVKTFKKCLKATLMSAEAESKSTNIDQILQQFLFDYRTAVHSVTKETPARLMFNRNIRNRFDLLRPNVSENIDKGLANQQRFFKGNRITQFEEGDLVNIRNHSDPNHPGWMKAKIIEVLGNREYVCKTIEGERIIKRHLDQIWPFNVFQQEPSTVETAKPIISTSTTTPIEEVSVSDTLPSTSSSDMLSPTSDTQPSTSSTVMLPPASDASDDMRNRPRRDPKHYNVQYKD